MTNRTDWSAASQAVEAANAIIIVTHVSPDGDAIGSLLGLANVLRERGKSVDCAVDGGVPAFLNFLPRAGSTRDRLKKGNWDLLISVDASDEERTGEVGEYARAHSKQSINLDHHPTNTLFGDIFLVMPDAVSASEVIYHWLNHMNHDLSADVATPLLAGLATDTLGFRTSNVTPETMHIATQLMAAGASLPEIMARTLESKSYRTVELWKHALDTVALRGQVVEAVVSQAALKAAGLDEVTDGGLVGLLSKVNEARVAVVFKELENGRVEISLRCKPGYDVAQVAFSVGGGGHKQASGATIDGPIEAARERILPMLQKVANNGAAPTGD